MKHDGGAFIGATGGRTVRRVRRSQPSNTRAAGATDPWQLNELVRRRRLREQGRRSLAVNLAEGIALSEFLSKFRGAARR